MKCNEKELLMILPQRLRSVIEKDELPILQEIRLRVGRPVQLVTQKGTTLREARVNPEDISFVINAASRYSPWSAASLKEGYLTAPGGHRIGVCRPNSLCIRVAKDLPGIGRGIDLRDSILIIGPPGSGKTTLLRDLIRRVPGQVSVVDERGEIFPTGFDFGDADVLTGTAKPQGVTMVLRSMGPEWIAVDEITAAADCEALVQAGWCGVKLMATAHAANLRDLQSREVYKPLVQTKLFRTVVVLRKDKSFTVERVVL